MLTGVVVGSTLALAALLSAPALLPAGDDPATATAALVPAADSTAASPGAASSPGTGVPGAGTTGTGPTGTGTSGAPAGGATEATAPAIPRPGSVGPFAPGAPASDALAALALAVVEEPAVEPIAAETSDTGSPNTGSPVAAEEPDEAAPAPSGPEAEVVALTNDRRADAGCGALRIDPRITAAAQRHSEDMASAGYFSHDSRDGRSFVDRLSAAGYPSPGAENIAQGQPDAASVVQAWMDSPGHRKNIEDCSLTTIGIGLAGDADYWTQDFGR